MENYINTLKIPFRKVKRFLKIIKLSFNVRYIRKKIKRRIEEGQRFKVVFFVQYPEMWNSVKSVYEIMQKDDKFEVLIITFPKRIGVNLEKPNFYDNDDANDFFKLNGIKSRSAYKQGTWIDISKISPDIIFVQRTYDEYLPEEFSLSKLSKLALLMYIPYSYQFGPGIHLQTEYNQNALNNLYMIFAESKDSYEYIVQNSTVELQIECRKVYNIGFPRFDILQTTLDKRRDNISSFLWIPRWSDDSLYDKGNFLKYYIDIISYFEHNKNLSLIIRPHPLMFNNYIDKKIMTEDEVEALKLQIDKIENIKLDTNLDYIETFKISDALIADFSGLIAEFFVTGKPIIYCGDAQSFISGIGKAMYETFYISKTSQQLLENINNLAGGLADDSTKRRIKIINDMFKGKTTCANRIVNTIVNELSL